MFHSKEGLGFEKGPNGSVIVEVGLNDEPNSPRKQRIELDKDTWDSVIATVSYYGEEDYGYYRALEFHAKIPVHETCPLKDKPRLDWK